MTGAQAADPQLIDLVFAALNFGPLWGAVGIIGVKAVDYFQAKRKGRREELAEINSAHANLNKSLQGSLDALSRELRRMREENEDLRSMLERRERRVEELEAEIEVLRRRIVEEAEADTEEVTPEA